MSKLPDLAAEWLEADGLGGFASGTVGGIRTRRYHALFLPATTPPTGRYMLVNGAEVIVETPLGRYELSAQSFGPNVTCNASWQWLTSFKALPMPTWTWELPGGYLICHELCCQHGVPATLLRWRLLAAPTDSGPVTLAVRFFLSGRDFHALHHENAVFDFTPDPWQPYPNIPAFRIATNGRYKHQPTWYRNFFYAEEAARGFPATEDLAAPGLWHFSLTQTAECRISTQDTTFKFSDLWATELARRHAFPSPLHFAADAYLVKRGNHGTTIIAGYPWFGDWGRDTFISLRGLCLATGRLGDAESILLEWAGAVQDGLMPNRFPDHGETVEFNSVDAPLWYCIAVHDYLEATAGWSAAAAAPLKRAVLHIVHHYANGTHHGIHMAADHLIFAGAPGLQLTWMDAKVDGWVVTPRIGKPVEIQALWINSLRIASRWEHQWQTIAAAAEQSFQEKFWLPQLGYLADVVGETTTDTSLRPNQIFALGGLPYSFLPKEMLQSALTIVKSQLLTPLGLRTLTPGSPDYAPFYSGGPLQRDAAYHQGTVWPWLMGPFVEAWIKCYGGTPTPFLAAFPAHLATHGLGHMPEIADATAPHSPNGCPFQAWSLAEYLRLVLGKITAD